MRGLSNERRRSANEVSDRLRVVRTRPSPASTRASLSRTHSSRSLFKRTSQRTAKPRDESALPGHPFSLATDRGRPSGNAALGTGPSAIIRTCRIRPSRRRTGRRPLDDERVSVWPRGPATARTRATPRTTVRPPRWSRFGRRRRRTSTQVPTPLRRAPVGTRLRLETRAYAVRGDTFGTDSYAFPSARYSSDTGPLLVVSTAWRVGSDRITARHRPLGSSHGLIVRSRRRIRRATVTPQPHSFDAGIALPSTDGSNERRHRGREILASRLPPRVSPADEDRNRLDTEQFGDDQPVTVPDGVQQRAVPADPDRNLLESGVERSISVAGSDSPPRI